MEAAGAAMERTSLGYVQDPGEMAGGECGFQPVRLLAAGELDPSHSSSASMPSLRSWTQ